MMDSETVPIEEKIIQYASEFSDSQWAIIAPLFPPAGNKSKWEKRELVDAVLYLVDNGCKWRDLPHDFPVAYPAGNGSI